MLLVKSEKANYGINFPTNPEEITSEHLKELTSNVNLPKHYAIVAIINRISLFNFAASTGNKKDYDVAVTTKLAKINPDENSIKVNVGDRIIIDRSAIERGNHFSARTMVSYTNAAHYFKEYPDLYLNIVKGGFEHSNSDICLLEFKIVPIIDIKGAIDETVKVNDAFIDKKVIAEA